MSYQPVGARQTCMIPKRVVRDVTASAENDASIAVGWQSSLRAMRGRTYDHSSHRPTYDAQCL